MAQLKSLTKQFGLDTSDFEKGFFPYKFDKSERWNYVDKYSDISYYVLNEMRLQKSKRGTNNSTTNFSIFIKKWSAIVFKMCEFSCPRCK